LAHLSSATRVSSRVSAPALVTGGTGFLGRRLVERLINDGRSVTILGRTPAANLEERGVRFIRASLDDPMAVRAACAGIETVFHAAAKVGVWGRYEDFFGVNVLGTRALLDGCREHGVARLVYTSTPSVVYNGRDLAGVDESAPLTRDCPSPYPLTKALAERDVLTANSATLRTIALRPHLIWGVGDPHLVPRVLERARAGRIRIIGDGRNRVDMVHVENAVDAHMLAEHALLKSDRVMDQPALSASPATPTPNSADGLQAPPRARPADGRAFFISNGEPVVLWEWINDLLRALGESPIEKHVSLRSASLFGTACELAWRALPLRGEPPMTRFVAAELAKDHWFDITAARRDLGYAPRISMAAGLIALVASLKKISGSRGS
jgi:2-alkyl-3-oxoalkanoate reductase